MRMTKNIQGHGVGLTDVRSANFDSVCCEEDGFTDSSSETLPFELYRC